MSSSRWGYFTGKRPASCFIERALSGACMLFTPPWRSPGLQTARHFRQEHGLGGDAKDRTRCVGRASRSAGCPWASFSSQATYPDAALRAACRPLFSAGAGRLAAVLAEGRRRN